MTNLVVGTFFVASIAFLATVHSIPATRPHLSRWFAL